MSAPLSSPADPNAPTIPSLPSQPFPRSAHSHSQPNFAEDLDDEDSELFDNVHIHESRGGEYRQSDNSDDELGENSTIIHPDNPHGHRISFSQSDFTSPPPRVFPDPSTSNINNSSRHVIQSIPGTSTASSAAASSIAAESSIANSTPKSIPSKEEIATIEYYLRQALAAKDLTALTDLVARADDKGISTDLVRQARSMLVDRATEEREQQVATLKHYMKQSLASRRVEPIKDVLKKVEPVAASISGGPHRRLHADFFALLDDCYHALDELEREDAQTVTAYLKQGIQTRSREVLQAALAKSASIKHELLDENVLNQAKVILAELDDHVLLRNFLNLAIKNRDLPALEETLVQLHRIGVTDTPEVGEARKLLDELKDNSAAAKHKQKDKAEKEARQQEKERQKQAEKEARQLEKEKKMIEKEKLAAEAHMATPPADKAKSRTQWFTGGSSSSGGKKSLSSSSKATLFGGSLTEAIRRNAPSPLPRICVDCMDFMRRHALEEAGLFRVAGNKDSIDLLRAQYEEAFTKEEAETPKLTEIHDVSGLFKLYIRSLPEPLIPYEFYDRFVKIGMNKGSDRIAQLRELVHQLPKANIGVLAALSRFLLEVSHHQSVNKMSPDNLAIVFAPNLIRPRVETPASMMAEMPSAISVIAALIAEAEQIFRKDEPQYGNGNGNGIQNANGAMPASAASVSAPSG